ncbi:MAG TPA: NusG domain II-containing protein [Firmicutes bacterium]|nr:NusG domain II-containing protein [Bacillota bacterium]
MRLRLKPVDLLIIMAVLAVGLGSLWYNLSQAASPPEQKYAKVYVDNKLVSELSLPDHHQFIYRFNFGEGNHQAQLEVDRGRIRMFPLDRQLCPRGICSHTGWISEPYESIVCLPNRIMIIFTGGPPAGDDIDGITY